MTDTRSVLVLRAAGTQEQMGGRLGALTRRAGGFDALLDYYQEMPRKVLLSGTRLTAVDRGVFAALTPLFGMWLRRLERRRPHGYRRRTEAFFEALGRSPSDSRYLGVMELFQNFVGLAARWGLVPFARRAAASLPPACSSLVVWDGASADGKLLHARNFDFPGVGIWERGPVVVFCDPDEGHRYGYVSSRGADVPVTAFNEAGLTAAAHTRLHTAVDFTGATVVDLVHAMVHRCATIEQAVDLARGWPSASSWGIVVSSAAERRAVVIEVSAAGAHVVRPEGAWIASTNRYQHPAQQVDEVTLSAAWVEHCEGRLERLGQLARAGEEGGGLDVAGMTAVLGDHGDHAREPGSERAGGPVLAQPNTVQSVVVSPEDRCVYVAVDDVPTGRGRYVRVDWSWEGVSSEHVGDAAVSAPIDTRKRPSAGSIPSARRSLVRFSTTTVWPFAMSSADKVPTRSSRFLVTEMTTCMTSTLPSSLGRP